MATQFSIDDAFVLEGDEEEGAVSDGEPQGWKDREGGEMTFGPLTFSKPQTHPSPAAAAGSLEHSNLKYQNLENEDALGSNGNSSFNNFFKISDPANLSYCSSQWSFSTLSSVTQLSAHCCGCVSHPLVRKTERLFLLLSFSSSLESLLFSQVLSYSSIQMQVFQVLFSLYLDFFSSSLECTT
uniref:Transmembrane protein 134 n=1 Tax=Labrus bergylta TaxID=56723 RepID=A0A3Q3H1B1_9LABR